METIREILVLQLSILQTLFNHPEFADKIHSIIEKDNELYEKVLDLITKIDSL